MLRPRALARPVRVSGVTDQNTTARELPFTTLDRDA